MNIKDYRRKKEEGVIRGYDLPTGTIFEGVHPVSGYGFYLRAGGSHAPMVVSLSEPKLYWASPTSPTFTDVSIVDATLLVKGA